MERITATMTMTLRSDTIFGSGFSIPGGEDIAVCQDELGYPYLKGSTLKGLLRESLSNYLAWTGQEACIAGELCGEEGWEGAADGRRIQLTGLYLQEKPRQPEECYSLRTFTSVENGVAEAGTLRTAVCVNRELCFVGEITFRRDDMELLKKAVQGIKWVGTLRNRGFGRVVCALEGQRPEERGWTLKPSRWIRYRLLTQLPLIITDFSHSQDNSYDTRGYIPGSAMRGMVMHALANRDPAWFEKHRISLLSEKTRFLDAVPWQKGRVTLPGLRCFYSQKGSDKVVNVLQSDVFGMKGVQLGACCWLEGDVVHGWSPSTSGQLRIQRKKAEEDTKMFQTRHIDAGQVFEGYIYLEEPDLAAAIGQAFGTSIWLGADRYEGYGKCKVLELEEAETPGWYTYGYGLRDTTEDTLYLLTMSPLTMLNEWGEPCGLDLDILADRLGVEKVDVERCSTAMVVCGGYNRTWQCRVPGMSMYDRGSVFRLRCSAPPEVRRLLDLQQHGLGVRRAEGFGQVLFLRKECLEQVRYRAAENIVAPSESGEAAKLRRAKYRWITEHVRALQGDGLSRSQLGTIQALCEQAKGNGGDARNLLAYLKKNHTRRGAAYSRRFGGVKELVEQVLNHSMEELLGEPCEDSQVERLHLLCMLFDHSRKEVQP